jgi:hypothetical protein
MGMSTEEIMADPRLMDQELRRSKLKKLLTDARTVQSQIFKLLQKLTGVEHANAGMDYVPEEEPVVAEDASVADALDVVNQLLSKRKP